MHGEDYVIYSVLNTIIKVIFKTLYSKMTDTGIEPVDKKLSPDKLVDKNYH